MKSSSMVHSFFFFFSFPVSFPLFYIFFFGSGWGENRKNLVEF